VVGDGGDGGDQLVEPTEIFSALAMRGFADLQFRQCDRRTPAPERGSLDMLAMLAVFFVSQAFCFT
jgi:hypothetical protein